MFPVRHDGSFVSCRQLVSAVQFSRSHFIPPNKLIEKVTSLENGSDRSDEDIPLLSERQRQIVPPFIRHIYAADTFFAKRERLPIHKHPPKSILFTSAQVGRYIEIQRAVQRGAPESIVCLQTYKKRLAATAAVAQDAVPEVPTRRLIPRLWEDLLVYLILALRHN